jgi:hypothetical protein
MREQETFAIESGLLEVHVQAWAMTDTTSKWSKWAGGDAI